MKMTKEGAHERSHCLKHDRSFHSDYQFVVNFLRKYSFLPSNYVTKFNQLVGCICAGKDKISNVSGVFNGFYIFIFKITNKFSDFLCLIK